MRTQGGTTCLAGELPFASSVLTVSEQDPWRRTAGLTHLLFQSPLCVPDFLTFGCLSRWEIAANTRHRQDTHRQEELEGKAEKRGPPRTLLPGPVLPTSFQVLRGQPHSQGVWGCGSWERTPGPCRGDFLRGPGEEAVPRPWPPC